jgi:hypothetical protein
MKPLTIALGLWLALSHGAAGEAPWQCPAKPVEPCFTHHGRLSSSNGSGLTIWLIGTTRRVRVDNEIPALMAKFLDMASPNNSEIFGDFNICPVEPDEPGHMRSVCIAGAKKLIVRNLQGSRAPFKLLSTWPQTK